MAYLWAAVGVALLHGLQPQHWLPYGLAARSEGWSTPRLTGVALGGTLLHLAATLLLALLAAGAGYGRSHLAGDTLTRLGGLLLIGMGIATLLQPAAWRRLGQRAGWGLAVAIGVQPCPEVIPLLAAAALAGPGAVLKATLGFAGATLIIVPLLAWLVARNLPPQLVAAATVPARLVVGVVLIMAGGLALLHFH